MLDIEKIEALCKDNNNYYAVGIKATTENQYDKVKDFLMSEGALDYSVEPWSARKSKTILVVDQDGDFTTLDEDEESTVDQFMDLTSFKRKFVIEPTKQEVVPGDPKASEGLVAYEVKDMNIIQELNYNGTKIWIQIDHRKGDVSFVEFNGNTQKWEPKRWLFSARGEEYLNGWQKILDAMKSATEYGRDELRKGKEK